MRNDPAKSQLSMWVFFSESTWIPKYTNSINDHRQWKKKKKDHVSNKEEPFPSLPSASGLWGHGSAVSSRLFVFPEDIGCWNEPRRTDDWSFISDGVRQSSTLLLDPSPESDNTLSPLRPSDSSPLPFFPLLPNQSALLGFLWSPVKNAKHNWNSINSW